VSANIAVGARNILETLSKEEVEALIEVLEYYNGHCREDRRAACMECGCKKKWDEDLEDRCKKALGSRGVVRKSRTVTEGEIYLSVAQPVCPYCRR
jgi:hypothetical protein